MQVSALTWMSCRLPDALQAYPCLHTSAEG
jgi:hypothetical protein